MEFYYWIIAMVVFGLLEGLTMGLTSIWFMIGALVAAIVSFFTDSILVQGIVFFAVSIICLFGTRPWAKKYLNSRVTATNVDRLVGESGVVTIPIDNLRASGQISVKGSYWTARTEDDDCKIEKDATVKIIRLEGAKCIVEPR